jgi:hypothetical protein
MYGNLPSFRRKVGKVWRLAATNRMLGSDGTRGRHATHTALSPWRWGGLDPAKEFEDLNRLLDEAASDELDTFNKKLEEVLQQPEDGHATPEGRHTLLVNDQASPHRQLVRLDGFTSPYL